MLESSDIAALRRISLPMLPPQLFGIPDLALQIGFLQLEEHLRQLYAA